MVTAVDSSVLIDVFIADTRYGESSKRAIRKALHEGGLVASDVVWAEIRSVFHTSLKAEGAMTQLMIEFAPTGLEASLLAGQTHRLYRSRGGSRERVIADFLIGAHAEMHADRLLTRDRGFYRNYFKSLAVLDASKC